jgi:hypothetical protein
MPLLSLDGYVSNPNHMSRIRQLDMLLSVLSSPVARSIIKRKIRAEIEKDRRNRSETLKKIPQKTA